MLETEQLALAKNLLLTSSELDNTLLQNVLSSAMTPQMDAADLYLQREESASWTLENGIIRSANRDLDQGFGLRAISGLATGFAYGNDLSPQALQSAAGAAKQIAKQGASVEIPTVHSTSERALYPAILPLDAVSESDVISYMQAIDREVRRRDPRICEVILNASITQDVVMVLHSDGSLGADVRPLVELHLKVIAKQSDLRAVGRAGAGGRGDWASIANSQARTAMIEKAVHQALLQLDAEPAPAGEFPVLLAGGWPAVLFHEAVGHGLEADFNRKGSSIYSGRIGERVAPECVTLVDDATIPGRRGSLTIDDEGIVGQYTVLIEKGILRRYMTDRHNAKLMGVESTGNGRRESYSTLPLPRMTNTYLLPDSGTMDDMLQDIKKGIYAVDFSGGQVDITSGTFVFTTSEAYLIEDGKITRPLLGATLIGNGPETLNRIEAVGQDLAMDSGIGVCGKAGQTVPVGVGQPAVKISRMTVGGAQ